MKHIVLFILSFVIFSCTGNQNSKATTKKYTKEGLPEFEFQEEIHNFETLKAGEVVIYNFEFTNSGTNNLEIHSIESDCGCLKANIEKKIIEPGQKEYIEVIFNTAGLWGKQFKTIKIVANTKQKTKELAILADVDNENIIRN